jgi:WD40 repeat protein
VATNDYHGTTRLFDAKDGRVVGKVEDCSNCTAILQFLPNGGWLATQGEHGIQIWDLPCQGKQPKVTRMEQGVPPCRYVMSLSHDGLHAVTVEHGDYDAYNGAVWLWNTLTFKPLKKLVDVDDPALPKRHVWAVGSVAFSPDDKLMVTAGGATDLAELTFWETTRWTAIRSIRVPQTKGCSCVVFSPDGKNLALATGEPRRYAIKLLDVSSGKVWATLATGADGIWELDFTANGRLLAAGGGNAVHIWDFAALCRAKPQLAAANRPKQHP